MLNLTSSVQNFLRVDTDGVPQTTYCFYEVNFYCKVVGTVVLWHFTQQTHTCISSNSIMFLLVCQFWTRLQDSYKYISLSHLSLRLKLQILTFSRLSWKQTEYNQQYHFCRLLLSRCCKKPWEYSQYLRICDVENYSCNWRKLIWVYSQIW